MAEASYIKSLFGATDAEVKKAADQAFTYLLGNLTLGAKEVGRRAKNFQWYWLEGTTPAEAQTEFSIAHGLGKTPMVVIPVLPVNEVGAQLIPLQVSRAADDKRVYLKSSSTSAAFSILVE